MAARSAPVMAPATPSVIPALQEAVTNPASAPQSRAIAALALRCRSSISTNSRRMALTASTASGTTIEAPSAVIVPETLMTGRTPSRVRISAALIVRPPLARGDSRTAYACCNAAAGWITSAAKRSISSYCGLICSSSRSTPAAS